MLVEGVVEKFPAFVTVTRIAALDDRLKSCPIEVRIQDSYLGNSIPAYLTRDQARSIGKYLLELADK